MKIREIIIGDEILIEIVSDDLEEAHDGTDSSSGAMTVDLVPDMYAPY